MQAKGKVPTEELLEVAHKAAVLGAEVRNASRLAGRHRLWHPTWHAGYGPHRFSPSLILAILDHRSTNAYDITLLYQRGPVCY